MGIILALDVLVNLRYNTFLKEIKMSDAKTLKRNIDSLMLQIQDLLDQAGLDEHERLQNAFNAFAIELDDVVF
jgi:hypothetical protein